MGEWWVSGDKLAYWGASVMAFVGLWLLIFSGKFVGFMGIWVVLD